MMMSLFVDDNNLQDLWAGMDVCTALKSMDSESRNDTRKVVCCVVSEVRKHYLGAAIYRSEADGAVIIRKSISGPIFCVIGR